MITLGRSRTRAPSREPGGFELWEMDPDDVVLSEEPDRVGPVRRHHHALAGTEGDRNSDDANAGAILDQRQRGVVLRREDGHLVAASTQRVRQPLDVDRQAAEVRPVVRERLEDPHSAGTGTMRSSDDLLSRIQSASRPTPSSTGVLGCHPKQALGSARVAEEHLLVSGPCLVEAHRRRSSDDRLQHRRELVPDGDRERRARRRC